MVVFFMILKKFLFQKVDNLVAGVLNYLTKTIPKVLDISFCNLKTILFIAILISNIFNNRKKLYKMIQIFQHHHNLWPDL